MAYFSTPSRNDRRERAGRKANTKTIGGQGGLGTLRTRTVDARVQAADLASSLRCLQRYRSAAILDPPRRVRSIEGP